MSEEIEEEKEIIRRTCLGLIHPNDSNQEEFTKWLQETVIFHLDNLEMRILKKREHDD